MDQTNYRGFLIIFGVIAVAAILAVALFGPNYSWSVITGNGTSTSTTPATGGTQNTGAVVLKLNETHSVGNISITPKAVLEDSRCPSDVQCIQAGTVRVQINVVTPDQTRNPELAPGDTVVMGGYSVTLAQVNPAPVSTHKITDTEYAFTVSIAQVPQAHAGGPCYVGGCSAEVCSDEKDVVSNCIYKPSFACYKNATCERQASGACGWTDSEALKQCLSSAPAGEDVQ